MNMFKEKYTLEERCKESEKIQAKYPDYIPVILEKAPGAKIGDIDRKKYLVPSDITVGQFMVGIKKRIQRSPGKVVYFFVDKTPPQSNLTMAEVYQNHRDQDGFLYMAYSEEKKYREKKIQKTYPVMVEDTCMGGDVCIV